jgi:hypothetical protein
MPWSSLLYVWIRQKIHISNFTMHQLLSSDLTSKSMRIRKLTKKYQIMSICSQRCEKMLQNSKDITNSRAILICKNIMNNQFIIYTDCDLWLVVKSKLATIMYSNNSYVNFSLPHKITRVKYERLHTILHICMVDAGTVGTRTGRLRNNSQ